MIRTARASVDSSAELLVTGTGSKFILDPSLSTGSASDETFVAGTIRVSGTVTVDTDGFVSADRVYVAFGGRVDGDGGTIAVGQQLLAGNAFFNQGLIATGASPGRLTIDGDFVQEETGVIEVEIGGSVPGEQYDVLEITGDAVIGGKIVFQFIDGFAPQQGEMFEFLNVLGDADLSGLDFEVRNLLTGFEYDVTATSSGFQMQALNNGVFVPEPGTGVAWIVIAGALGSRMRRRRLFPTA